MTFKFPNNLDSPLSTSFSSSFFTHPELTGRRLSSLQTYDVFLKQVCVILKPLFSKVISRYRVKILAEYAVLL